MSEQDRITSAETQVAHVDALEALIRKVAREEIAKAFREMSKTAMFCRNAERFDTTAFKTMTTITDIVDCMDLEEVE